MTQHHSRRTSWRLTGLVAVSAMCLVVPVLAGQGEAVRRFTAADYTRAERFLAPATTPLVFGLNVLPNWLRDGRFWYRRITGPEINEFVLVDPVRKSRQTAFDHARIASALQAATGRGAEARNLPFTTLEYAADGREFTLAGGGVRLTCQTDSSNCRQVTGDRPAATEPVTGLGRAGGGGGRGGAAAGLSPDGKRLAFIRDYNLWIRDVASEQEFPLTTDGVKDFGYATNNAGWTKSDVPVVVWSPDSKKIATFQHDGRLVGEMYLVSTTAGHPALQAWKYPLPGDDKIFMIERVIVDVDTRKVTRLLLPPDPHRSSLCDHVVCGGVWADVQWSTDGRQLAFVSTSRDHKHAIMRLADAATGEVRQILDERVETFFESGNGRVNWRYLQGSNEVLWFSERDNWGQLYLYDASSGKPKQQITTGEGNVTQVLRVDEKNRVIYFLGMGRERGRDPYFRHFYRVDFDGRNARLLTPDDGDHTITLSPDGRFFVDAYSKPDVAPVSVLRDARGQLVVPLEKADISRLEATGWKPPMPVTMKARDGTTDIYGLLFRPTNFDPSLKYPIVNHIYPGPQSGSVGSRSFSPARSDAQALAELGFIVVQIDGMGTPGRSKKFHDTYYGNMGDNTLPDQVAGMRELARRFPWIDLERAGIWGHSGGGYAAADAMFRYPDFFKVGISESGNHDNRAYEDDWGEKWQGLLTRGPNGTTSYDNQANQLQAKNLKGKLLLAHGTLDANVPPYNTLLVVDELIKADKDFDLLMLPNQGHGFGNASAYMMRRRWDYFIRHLMGAEPPQR
jgi:dipeptidyl aminopeptidase/acylaminoacyl peptidase